MISPRKRLTSFPAVESDRAAQRDVSHTRLSCKRHRYIDGPINRALINGGSDGIQARVSQSRRAERQNLNTSLDNSGHFHSCLSFLLVVWFCFLQQPPFKLCFLNLTKLILETKLGKDFDAFTMTFFRCNTKVSRKHT